MKHILSSPLLRIHSGKHCSARSQQQLETYSLESHKEERLWQGEADAPSFSRHVPAAGTSVFASYRASGNFCISSSCARKPDIPPNDSPASTLHQRHQMGLIATARLALLPKPGLSPRAGGLEGNVCDASWETRAIPPDCHIPAGDELPLGP